jgi:hypothetical protein
MQVLDVSPELIPVVNCSLKDASIHQVWQNQQDCLISVSSHHA